MYHAITGNPFFLSTEGGGRVSGMDWLCNETDEDLSPASRAFLWARIIRVSFCNQIAAVMTPKREKEIVTIAINESDNPDNLYSNVKSVYRTVTLLISRLIRE